MNLIKAVKLRRNLLKISLVIVLFFVGLTVVGCGGIAWPTISWPGSERSQKKLYVVPQSNQNVASLNADDIVKIMRWTAFSDEQILELGADVRNGLLLSGAVYIKSKNKVEATFAVHGDYVFISSRIRGSFFYDIKNGTFGIGKTGSPKS
jgi:hypothetical protein